MQGNLHGTPVVNLNQELSSAYIVKEKGSV